MYWKFQLTNWFLVEHPTVSSLPGGVVVKCCLLTLPPERSACLPVVLTNEADHDVIIPQRCIIAEINAMEFVLSSNRAVSKSDSQSIEPEMSKESKETLVINHCHKSGKIGLLSSLTKCLRSLPTMN